MASSSQLQESGPTYPYSRFEEDACAEECVEEIIETVLEGVNLDISTKSVRLIENGLMAEVALYKLHEVVHLATVQHDGDHIPGQTLELFVPDVEPVPPPIDNWARGAVASRIVKVNDRFNENMVHSDGTRTPSVTSFRSSSTRSRSTTHTRGLSSRERAARQTSGAVDGSDAPRIIERDDEGSYFGVDGGMHDTGHMYDMLQKQKHRLKQLTHTDDTVKDEFQLQQEEVDRAAEELKGKNYIFDHNGQIVVIQPLKSEQLPPFSFNPSLNVNNADSTVQEEPKKKTAVTTQGQKKKKKLRVAGSRAVEDPGDRALFIPTSSLATTIAGTSYDMPLNNGVAIETNKISKEGPPIADDPRKPSRKEYFSRKATAATASMDASWDEGVRHSHDDSFHSIPSELGGDPSSHSLLVGEKSSTFTGGQRFKDIDPLEGGRPKPQPSQVSPNNNPESNRAGGGSSGRASEEGGKKGKQKPALEPTKPSPRQQNTVNLLHGGSHLQGPRDRLSSQILHTRADKKKYVVPAKSNTVGDDQSYSSFDSKKSNGTIKRERLARDLF